MLYIVQASDYEEFRESGNSFQYEIYRQHGFDADAAASLVEESGEEAYARYQILEYCFLAFHVMDEFEEYATLDESFKLAKDTIKEMQEIAVEAMERYDEQQPLALAA